MSKPQHAAICNTCRINSTPVAEDFDPAAENALCEACEDGVRWWDREDDSGNASRELANDIWVAQEVEGW